MLKTVKAIGSIGRMFANDVNVMFADSLAELLIYEHSKLPRGQYIHYDKATVSWHELGRNQLVEKAIGDWLLMLDTDHTFAPDLLERLMRLKRKYKAQVISAAYQYKFPPHSPVANMWQETDAGTKVLPIVSWNREADILPVGSCGAGALLIDTAVLKYITNELKENPFTIVPGLSEDYSFCFRCKKLGIPIYWAPKVESHHVINTVLHLDDYKNQEGVKI